MKGTTISDKELATWSAIKRADDAHAYDFTRHGWGAPSIVTFLAGENLEMRRILRDFLSRHDESSKDPLVLRAADILGFNIHPAQMFEWPKREAPSVSEVKEKSVGDETRTVAKDCGVGDGTGEEFQRRRDQGPGSDGRFVSEGVGPSGSGGVSAPASSNPVVTLRICAHCGRNPATCMGQYDNAAGVDPACDTCCGHGNEDGFCEPITYFFASVGLVAKAMATPDDGDTSDVTLDSPPFTPAALDDLAARGFVRVNGGHGIRLTCPCPQCVAGRQDAADANRWRDHAARTQEATSDTLEAKSEAALKKEIRELSREQINRLLFNKIKRDDEKDARLYLGGQRGVLREIAHAMDMTISPDPETSPSITEVIAHASRPITCGHERLVKQAKHVVRAWEDDPTSTETENAIRELGLRADSAVDAAQRTDNPDAVTATTGDLDRARLWIDEMRDLGIIAHFREAKAKARLADLIAEVRDGKRVDYSRRIWTRDDLVGPRGLKGYGRPLRSTDPEAVILEDLALLNRDR